MPDCAPARIADVASFLVRQDYVDALFVDGPSGAVPGALSLRDINLAGSARLPAPSIVVALKTFSRDPGDPIRSEVDVSDTTLQQGQGGHGSFGRADVTNTMIAFGVDFNGASSIARRPATPISRSRWPTSWGSACRAAESCAAAFSPKQSPAGRPLPARPVARRSPRRAGTDSGRRYGFRRRRASAISTLPKKFSGPIIRGDSFDGLPCSLPRRDPKATAKPTTKATTKPTRKG